MQPRNLLLALGLRCLLALLFVVALLLFALPSSPAQARSMAWQQAGTPQGSTHSQGTIYGVGQFGNTCENPGGGTIAQTITFLFNWPADRLSPKYQHDTVDSLCLDYWAWNGPQFGAKGTDVPVHELLHTLHWPADLFKKPWSEGTIHVHLIGFVAPVQPVTGPTKTFIQDGNGNTESTRACFLSLPFGQSFDLCQAARGLINAAAQAIGDFYHTNEQQLHFLWQTPLSPFQDDQSAGLIRLWTASWSIVLVCVTAVIAWGALRSMLGAVVSWLSYAQVLELLPRLVFALLAALLSQHLFILLIQANNALSGLFSSTTLQTIVRTPNPGIRLGLLQVIYGLSGLVLVVEEAARLAFIYILYAASPLLFFLAALPETQRWAQGAARAAILLIFLQAMQAFMLDVGNRIALSVLHQSDGSLSIVQLLLALAVLYVALATFVAVVRMAFGVGGYALAGGPLLFLGAAGRSVRALAVGGLSAAGLRGGRTITIRQDPSARQGSGRGPDNGGSGGSGGEGGRRGPGGGGNFRSGGDNGHGSGGSRDGSTQGRGGGRQSAHGGNGRGSGSSGRDHGPDGRLTRTPGGRTTPIQRTSMPTVSHHRSGPSRVPPPPRQTTVRPQGFPSSPEAGPPPSSPSPPVS
ncbi:MAG: hypothetical protein J2P36_20885 [Ktedonobacteraceae bacterium]|nr:hypothetical protein [Ktedonobacteraceae bacterium]